ncbi:gibberellin-regulated protein 14 [Ricinus communis]|uniref:Extensin, proline-rich protein, putative n=1 Tax=Ricinus communis TaxID=3988 RepID=B9RUF0_RICCO|nr:gibberellin-regulated protein 14 [Ricinus communis]EEF44937.1 extensin, proline-rich protein, putative [Ricinus communis]|eukprot:XP_002517395.1 gibberellin-regulated protein 14 [Ricinus communis]
MAFRALLLLLAALLSLTATRASSHSEVFKEKDIYSRVLIAPTPVPAPPVVKPTPTTPPVYKPPATPTTPVVKPPTSPAPPVVKPPTPSPPVYKPPTTPVIKPPNAPSPVVKPPTVPAPPVVKPPTYSPPVAKPPTPAPPVVKPPSTPAPPMFKPPTPLPPPSGTPLPPVRSRADCIPLCAERCKLHSRKNICTRACITCCDRCKCVPPGTYGNREKCGKCYTDMTTRHNKPKCP